MTEKKSYARPILQQWGNVSDITGVGLTRPGTDVKLGSVNPPGHNKKKG